MNSRRDFIRYGLGATAGLYVGSRLGSGILRAGEAAIRPPVRLAAPTKDRLPVLSVQGTYAEIGKAIGGELGMETQAMFYERRKWFRGLSKYAKSRAGKKNLSEMRAAAEKHTPHAMEELTGWASSCGVSLDEMFILNCKNEIDAFANTQQGCPGCSSVALKNEKGIWVVHNEDGHLCNEGRMFLLDAKPRGGTAFLSHTYPGIVSGNASWLNEHGVFMSCNYIPSAKVQAGIPRYFLYRKAIEAASVEEAVETFTHKERAYAGHHFIGSMVTGELVSLEVTPDNHSLKQVDGLMWHTNHLIHESMAKECQMDAYIGESSAPRYARLTELLGTAKPVDVTPEQMHKALSDHESTPTQVCRHAPPDPRGMTLGQAWFEAKRDGLSARPFKVNYIKGFPCEGAKAEYLL
jgi:predicted choloylglycine hydrolase